MSSPNQLTEQQRASILKGHHSFRHREMVRYWLLSERDLEVVNDRRRQHNRLGFAAQLCLLRYPGWPLKPGELPPPNLLQFVAAQLAVDPAGSVSDRTRLEQHIHAMAMNLVVAAITLWNTAYLDQALKACAELGASVPDDWLPHISRLGREHITITGTYTWKGSSRAPWGRFRPLRTVDSTRQELKLA